MSSPKPVIVYAASGYTGRLACEYLTRLKVPFVAAGRSQAKLEEVAGEMRSKGADCVARACQHTAEGLRALVQGAKVLITARTCSSRMPTPPPSASSPFMDVYAYAAREHMKRYGSTAHQLATIASKNPSGGLLSRGHPIGASGLAQIHELVTQLRGEAGARQVPDAGVALAENGGGALGEEEAAMCIHILEKPGKAAAKPSKRAGKGTP